MYAPIYNAVSAILPEDWMQPTNMTRHLEWWLGFGLQRRNILGYLPLLLGGAVISSLFLQRPSLTAVDPTMISTCISVIIWDHMSLVCPMSMHVTLLLLVVDRNKHDILISSGRWAQASPAGSPIPQNRSKEFMLVPINYKVAESLVLSCTVMYCPTLERDHSPSDTVTVVKLGTFPVPGCTSFTGTVVLGLLHCCLICSTSQYLIIVHVWADLPHI
jgi:hypothetical protein